MSSEEQNLVCSYIYRYIANQLDKMKDTCVKLSLLIYQEDSEIVFQDIPKLELYPNLYFWIQFRIVDNKLKAEIKSNDINLSSHSLVDINLDNEFGHTLRIIACEYIGKIELYELAEITRYIRRKDK